LIAAGGDKPAELPVKWNKPSAAQARQVADQARNFALVAAMAYAADLVDVFLRDIVCVDWMKFSDDTADIATKRSTGSGGHEYSMCERAQAVSQNLGILLYPLPEMLDLLSKWRNNLIHSHGSIRQISPKIKDKLLEYKIFLRDRYSNIEIDETIRHFEERRVPTRKDATVLLAAAQNLARQIDEAAIRRALPTPSSMEDLASSLLAERWSMAGGWSDFCSVWSEDQASRTISILKRLGQLGVTESEKAVSAELPMSYVTDLASLKREEAAVKLQLQR
jgi:hypothetical protein